MKTVLTHKSIWMLMALFALSGCFSTKYYVLSTASEPTQTYTYKNQMIGVEKVSVPEYMFKREIAVAKSASQIVLLSRATWGEDLDAGLTHRLISFLQKKFKQPNVYAYPWGVDKQPDVKIKVYVTRFIAQGMHVYLDANWKIENMKTGEIKAKLFSTKVDTSSDASTIVSAMDRAFSELEEVVADALRKDRIDMN